MNTLRRSHDHEHPHWHSHEHRHGDLVHWHGHGHTHCHEHAHAVIHDDVLLDDDHDNMEGFGAHNHCHPGHEVEAHDHSHQATGTYALHESTRTKSKSVPERPGCSYDPLPRF